MEIDFEGTKAIILEQIKTNPILIYMKGTPAQPYCGFSARAVQCLKECDVPFASVNILENLAIRAVLPKIANWPTFPQVWVNGELIGGCDIVSELHQAGTLEKLLKAPKS